MSEVEITRNDVKITIKKTNLYKYNTQYEDKEYKNHKYKYNEVDSAILPLKCSTSDCKSPITGPEMILDSNINPICYSKVHCDYPECNFIAKSKAGLLKHNTRHDKNKVKSKSDYRSSSLQYNQKMRLSTKSKPFNCKYCRKSYINEYTLEKHMFEKHPNILANYRPVPALLLIHKIDYTNINNK